MTATRTSWRAAAALAATALAALLGGCAGVETAAGPIGPSVMSAAELDAARQWQRQWPEQGDLIEPEGAVELLVVGAPARSGSEQQVRFTTRVVLLDAESRPIRADGSLRVLLLARLAGGEMVATGGWRFGPAQVDAAHRPGVMPGYVFDLRWPRMPTTSIYQAVFRWESPDGRHRLTRSVMVEDSLRGPQSPQ